MLNTVLSKVQDVQWICIVLTSDFSSTLPGAEQSVRCTGQATSLLLLNAVNINVNLLVIETDIASNGA